MNPTAVEPIVSDMNRFGQVPQNRLKTRDRKRRSPVSAFVARVLIIFEMQKEIYLDEEGILHENHLTVKEIAERTGISRERVSAVLKTMKEVKPRFTYSRKYKLVHNRPILRPGSDRS